MLNVSYSFLEAMQAPARQTTATVLLNLNNSAKPQTAIVTGDGTQRDASTIVRGFLSSNELQYTGGECPEVLKSKQAPFISTQRSDATGKFATPVKLTVTYGADHTTQNILLTGNPHDLLGDVTITCYKNEVAVLTKKLKMKRARDGIYIPTKLACDKIELEILSTRLPNRPATVYYFGSPGQLIIERDYLAETNILEELGADDLLPYAPVTANEADVVLDNVDSVFTPSNKTSPLHGLMAPGSKLEVFFGVAITGSLFDMVPMGTYFITEWSAPNDSSQSSIIAHDRLYDLIGEDIPLLKVVHGETITGIFRRIMDAMKIPSNKYRINVNSTILVPFGYLPGETVGDVFNLLSEAGLCYIYVDRQDRITLTDSGRQSPVMTMKDTDYIQTINNLERYNTIYNKLTVDINEPILRRTEKMLDGYQAIVDPGVTTLDDITFPNVPVVLLNSVSLFENHPAFIETIDYGHDRLRLKVNNSSGAVMQIQISAAATYLDSLKRTRSIPGSTISRTSLRISNPLIQTAEHADRIMAGMQNAISDPFSLFEFLSRGNPALEVGDVIRIQAPAAHIEDEAVEIRRAEYRFDGGLECSYTTRRVRYA